MKNLDLNAMGVFEMSKSEILEVDGGFWDYVISYLIGKAIDALPEALDAACEIKAEGGTIACGMPSK